MTGVSGAPDPGRQPERTWLAWRRTILATTAVALLAARLAVEEAEPPLAAATIAGAVAGWVGVMVVSWRRVVTLRARTPVAPWRAVPLTAGAAIGFAALGAVLVAGR